MHWSVPQVVWTAAPGPVKHKVLPHPIFLKDHASPVRISLRNAYLKDPSAQKSVCATNYPARSLNCLPGALTARRGTAMSAAKASAAHRILLVEDESAILQFSITVLVRGSYQVTAVEDCEAAWEAMQSASYDLLLTNVVVPEMDGCALAARLRESPRLAAGVVAPPLARLEQAQA